MVCLNRAFIQPCLNRFLSFFSRLLLTYSQARLTRGVCPHFFPRSKKNRHGAFAALVVPSTLFLSSHFLAPLLVAGAPRVSCPPPPPHARVLLFPDAPVVLGGIRCVCVCVCVCSLWWAWVGGCRGVLCVELSECECVSVSVMSCVYMR
jgi:hypothetical protein